MQLNLTIQMDNAAFEPPHTGAEISRIFSELSVQFREWSNQRFTLMQETGDQIPIHDVNGNRVGSVSISDFSW